MLSQCIFDPIMIKPRWVWNWKKYVELETLICLLQCLHHHLTISFTIELKTSSSSSFTFRYYLHLRLQITLKRRVVKFLHVVPPAHCWNSVLLFPIWIWRHIELGISWSNKDVWQRLIYKKNVIDWIIEVWTQLETLLSD